MRRIGVITTSRADYSIYRPVLAEIQRHPNLDLVLFVSGSHLSPDSGMTVREIEKDGFPITERIEMLLASDSPESIAKSMGLTMLGFAQAYARSPIDLLLALGDRTEMLAAVSAALPFRIPVAHIGGGDTTLGAIDDAARHAITKLSHLHFPLTEQSSQCLLQLGEQPWRIIVSGNPGLDNLNGFKPLDPEQLQRQFGLTVDLDNPPLLVTFHSVTMEHEQTSDNINHLLKALAERPEPILFTYPNTDTGGRMIIDQINRFIDERENAQAAVNLGANGYLSILSLARAMIGNSSSGIVEAASFELPVVNIGSRQEGRLRSINVIDCVPDLPSLREAIRRALTSEFKKSLKGMRNLYGDGHAAKRIVQRFVEVELDERLLKKPFNI